MANKKLKYFEYANHTKKGKSATTNTDRLAFFECDNGSVFLLCQDNSTKQSVTSPSQMAVERMKYYLENEFVQNPHDALYNAFIYTNGFIYEYARKNQSYQGEYADCTCLLIRDNKVYTASTGELATFYFNCKKLFLVSKGQKDEENLEKSNQTNSDSHYETIHLGRQQNINPRINYHPIEPVNDDKLLLCSPGFYQNVPEKSIQKILSDPMPVQTKVLRLMDMAGEEDSQQNVSLQLISFYNLTNKERKFEPLVLKKGLFSSNKKKKTATISDETDSKATPKPSTPETPLEHLKEKARQPLAKAIIIALSAIILAYMFYDLFIYNPMPPVAVEVDSQVPEDAIEETQSIAADMTAETPPAESEPATVARQASIPDDTVYEVQSGDTWGRIYRQFEVCSWFIRNHPQNAGKFDRNDNPISGSRIYIPLIYSAMESYNPDFYTQFTTDKTGSSCENVDNTFLENFRTEHLN